MIKDEFDNYSPKAVKFLELCPAKTQDRCQFYSKNLEVLITKIAFIKILFEKLFIFLIDLDNVVIY